ncbi:hypothetical protein D3C81_481250 [compost metagenome]|uniref:Lipoprotein n=1 Tax=Pseudomonas wadenswilerensis TaxID=1785161 RepID=A0A380T342_9PSED|nr:Putative lipoprotein (modular protein) [Pseudomonas sp. JV241A]SUQ63936.1 Lipoprotein [Pseudomonas wadenswilerensis]
MPGRRCWKITSVHAGCADTSVVVRECALVSRLYLLRNGIIRTLTSLLLASTLFLASCGTFVARGSNSYSSGADYYKGTQANVQLLTMIGASGYDGYSTMFCWVTIVCPVFAIATLPVDMVVDTALLPHDAMN